MRKFLFILAIGLSFVGKVHAQTYGYDSYIKQIYSVNYQMSTPLGDSRDFISKMSFEGVNLNWAYFVTHNITVGFDVTYNNYHEKFSKSIYRPNDYTAINAAQYRYTQVFPIKAQVKYFYNPDRCIKPYIGVGIGALSAGEHIIVQDIDSWYNSWGFLLSPEIGALIPFGSRKNYGANVTFGYNWSTNESAFGDIHIKNRSSLYFNIGLYLAIY